MRAELTKSFVKKTIRKIIIFTLIMVVVASIGQAFSPVISNELALTQMDNSNEMFMIMNIYNKVKPIITIAYICVILYFVYTLGRDTYKFAKTINNSANDINGTNEKEK